MTKSRSKLMQAVSAENPGCVFLMQKGKALIFSAPSVQEAMQEAVFSEYTAFSDVAQVEQAVSAGGWVIVTGSAIAALRQ